MLSDDDRLFECEGCGDILTPGIEHDCPVTGTVHLITDTEAGDPA